MPIHDITLRNTTFFVHFIDSCAQLSSISLSELQLSQGGTGAKRQRQISGRWET
jgi:hypothetical protein